LYFGRFVIWRFVIRRFVAQLKKKLEFVTSEQSSEKKLLIAFFFGSKQFSLNFKPYSDRPIYIPMPDAKNQG
jgi:hypothetical protein